MGVLATENEDIRSLRELITYGLKGLSAYSKHANALLQDNAAVDAFLQRALAATLDDLLPRLDSLWEAGDHTAALKTLLEVRPVVDAFFDGVMVMCDDAALRANRLAMLNALGTRFARLADFAALQI